MAKRVLTGCKECKRCMNSAVGEGGRRAGRTMAFLVTGGASELAMLATKDCGACGHALSLHEEQAVTGWKQDRRGSATAARPKVEVARGEAEFACSPTALWSELTSRFPGDRVKRADAAERRLEISFPRVDGTPACVGSFRADRAGGHRSVLRYEIRPSVWGGAVAESDPETADRTTMRLRREAESLLERLRTRLEPRPDPVRIEPVGVAGPDPLAQLRGLADLHAAGVLTDAEFAAKKAEILARL